MFLRNDICLEVEGRFLRSTLYIRGKIGFREPLSELTRINVVSCRRMLANEVFLNGECFHLGQFRGYRDLVNRTDPFLLGRIVDVFSYPILPRIWLQPARPSGLPCVENIPFTILQDVDLITLFGRLEVRF